MENWERRVKWTEWLKLARKLNRIRQERDEVWARWMLYEEQDDYEDWVRWEAEEFWAKGAIEEFYADWNEKEKKES